MSKGARNRARRSRSDMLQKRWAQRMSFLLTVVMARKEQSDASS